VRALRSTAALTNDNKLERRRERKERERHTHAQTNSEREREREREEKSCSWPFFQRSGGCCALLYCCPYGQ